MTVTLREITDETAEPLGALRCGPGQERFVSSVVDSLAEAAEYPQANPWFRAVYADEQPVGFVMLSWDVEPQPPEINGPWFLWKLLVDHRHQGRGHGAEAVRLVAQLIKLAGANELLTSCFPDLDGSPAPFYERLGFAATGDRDVEGETIFRLELHHDHTTAGPGPDHDAQ